MTTKPSLTAREAARLLPPLPDPPKKDMQQFQNFVIPGIPSILALHFNATIPNSPILVSGEGYLCHRRLDLPSCPYPDLVVAFDVDQDGIVGTNGYVIEEAGKPPDFVLEVGSSTTGRRDYVDKRRIYAGMNIPEYWRFDHTGGEYQDAPLACDLLAADGRYQPMTLTTDPDGVIWGHSEALNLSVCWVSGKLRLWDRVQQRYLPNPMELTAERDLERQARADAEARANSERLARLDAEALANSERQARADAEARIRELEEELRRRDNA